MRVALAGATGLVGRTFLKVMEDRQFPVSHIRLLASERSVNREIRFAGKDWKVEPLTAEAFDNIDVAFFATEAEFAQEFGPIAVEKGCLVVDNSSAFRMDPGTPLVTPEVNGHLIRREAQLIANPNCSTIQLVAALAPLSRKFGLERVVVDSYQSVSGSGQAGLDQFEAEVRGDTPEDTSTFPRGIFGNCIPQISAFDDDGFTGEERKIMNETRKILDLPDLAITATAVRVPAAYSHGESVAVEFSQDYELADVRACLAESEGLEIVEPYPLQREVACKDGVYIGRLRRDPSSPRGLQFWVVADNLRKGAATNAVQIAEKWLEGTARA